MTKRFTAVVLLLCLALAVAAGGCDIKKDKGQGEQPTPEQQEPGGDAQPATDNDFGLGTVFQESPDTEVAEPPQMPG